MVTVLGSTFSLTDRVVAAVGEAAATAVRLRLLACLWAAELGAMAV